jgi:hypothetical protein
LGELVLCLKAKVDLLVTRLEFFENKVIDKLKSDKNTISTSMSTDAFNYLNVLRLLSNYTLNGISQRRMKMTSSNRKFMDSPASAIIEYFEHRVGGNMDYHFTKHPLIRKGYLKPYWTNEYSGQCEYFLNYSASEIIAVICDKFRKLAKTKEERAAIDLVLMQADNEYNRYDHDFQKVFTKVFKQFEAIIKKALLPNVYVGLFGVSSIRPPTNSGACVQYLWIWDNCKKVVHEVMAVTTKKRKIICDESDHEVNNDEDETNNDIETNKTARTSDTSRFTEVICSIDKLVEENNEENKNYNNINNIQVVEKDKAVTPRTSDIDDDVLHDQEEIQKSDDDNRENKTARTSDTSRFTEVICRIDKLVEENDHENINYNNINNIQVVEKDKAVTPRTSHIDDDVLHDHVETQKSDDDNRENKTARTSDSSRFTEVICRIDKRVEESDVENINYNNINNIQFVEKDKGSSELLSRKVLNRKILNLDENLSSEEKFLKYQYFLAQMHDLMIKISMNVAQATDEMLDEILKYARAKDTEQIACTFSKRVLYMLHQLSKYEYFKFYELLALFLYLINIYDSYVDELAYERTIENTNGSASFLKNIRSITNERTYELGL